MIDTGAVLGLVTARKGSRGLSDKHLRHLGGRPLIDWTFNAAVASRSLTRVILSTDDDRLIPLAEQFGIEVPFKRPAELATEEAPQAGVVRHALAWYEATTGVLPAAVVLLQPTSPFRTGADIDTAVAMFTEQAAPAVVGVAEPRDHPTLCYHLDHAGALLMDSSVGPEIRRQDHFVTYRINGAVYVNRPEDLLAGDRFVIPGTRPLVMSQERSVDIDTAMDLQWAEFCVQHGYASWTPA